MEALLLTLHNFVPIYLNNIRIILGIISYIFIPGYLLVKVLNINIKFEETLGLSLLFGFSIQILIITLFWALLIEPINLSLISYCTIAIIFIMLLRYSGNFHFKLQKTQFFSPAFFILFLTTFVRLYYFFINVSSLGIDGGLYCDFARTIVSEGKFSSHILNDGWLDPYFNVKGFLNYPLIVFSITTFFWIGDISYASAKLAVLFIGFLVVFLIYQISNVLFGSETALIAGLISAVFPLLSYYSSILHGPEILSTLFILASTYFFILGIKNDDCKLRYMSLSGLFAAMTHGAWMLQAFIPLLVTLALIFFLFKIKEEGKICFYALFLIVVLFFAYKLSAILFVQIPLTLIPFICLFIFCKRNKNLSYIGVTVFVSTVILSLQLFYMRSYLIPEMYIIQSTKKFLEDPIKIANPFSLTYGIHINLDYILKGFCRFWQSMVTILTPLLFGMTVASFFNPMKFKEKIATFIFPFLSSIMLIVALPEDVILFGNIFPDRFLVASTSFLIILSAVTIDALITTHEKIRYIIQIAGKRMKIDSRKVFLSLTFFILFSSLIPIHINYLYKFNENYQNVIKYYGHPVIEWIKYNSSPDDVFLAADPRRLAWFTNRTFVGMTTKSGKLDISELNSLIQNFNVSYVIIDTFFMNYIPHSDFFNNLYFTHSKLGQMYPIMKEDTIVSILDELVLSGKQNYIQEFYCLKLVFEYYSEDSRAVKIYRVVRATLLIRVEFQDNFVENWGAGNNGKLLAENGVSKLIIGKGMTYTFTYRRTPLNILLEKNTTKFFAWKVIEINNVKIERIELWSDKGEFLTNIIPPSSPGTWFTYINNNVTSIGDLRVVIKGKPEGYISIKYVVIGVIQIT
ncbi:MAG: glycosyltransferase family 39 protein [Candidatus Verstraetearchaeota archaeon]|nr:glycosyltransferase family 39 protein [Candidatus Verstraetearchaeota archaeon]